jgi:hypothetical protein
VTWCKSCNSPSKKLTLVCSRWFVTEEAAAVDMEDIAVAVVAVVVVAAAVVVSELSLNIWSH